MIRVDKSQDDRNELDHCMASSYKRHLNWEVSIVNWYQKNANMWLLNKYLKDTSWVYIDIDFIELQSYRAIYLYSSIYIYMHIYVDIIWY